MIIDVLILLAMASTFLLSITAAGVYFGGFFVLTVLLANLVTVGLEVDDRDDDDEEEEEKDGDGGDGDGDGGGGGNGGGGGGW
jgi:uncharacterized membrane protein YgcG